MIKIMLLGILLAGIFVLLYQQGYMALKSTSAVTFIGSAKGNGAKFTSCNGSIKRIVRFIEDGICTYTLDAELTKGGLSVELLDAEKEKIMQLDCVNRSASVAVESRKKYYLIIRFRSATGRYTLYRE